MADQSIVILTEDNFDKEVLQSPKPVLVDFMAEWCGPCKMLAPILHELADEYNGRMRFGQVDVDQQQNLAARYGIQAMPTLLLFNKGEVVQAMQGARGKKDLKASFDRLAA